MSTKNILTVKELPSSHQIFHVLSALGFYMGFAATGYFPAIERSLSTG